MHGVRVGFRMYGNRADAHFATGAMNTKGNFAAVGNQYFFKHYDFPKKLFNDD